VHSGRKLNVDKQPNALTASYGCIACPRRKAELFVPERGSVYRRQSFGEHQSNGRAAAKILLEVTRNYTPFRIDDVRHSRNVLMRVESRSERRG
jgi:hypothetical protein